MSEGVAKISCYFVTFMSLVAAIRDYIDFINSNYDALPLNGGLLSLVLPTFKYILESLKYATFYLASFQWLRDIVYLPLVVPNLTVSLLKETCYPFENPALNFFTFLETPAYRNNSFLVGLLNSFFACMPISASHILSGRRLLVQGVPAGLAAGSGTILGQWWFVACVVLGIRPLVVPWLALEPFNYLLGVGLLVNVVYRITHERRIKLVRWSDKKELLQYFLTSLLLSWCEQTSLFQYLSNITVDAGTSLLDNFSTGIGSSLQSANPFWVEIGYVGGLLIGSCLFSLLFASLALALRRVWLRWGAVTSSRLTNQLNSFFLVTLVAFSLASIPYYGMDYLLSNRIGFLAQDMALNNTVFAPATMDDTTGKMGVFSDKKSFDTDVFAFDRGLYLQQQKLVPQSFEDLNYQGEYTWTKRYGKYTRHLVKRKAPLVWSDLFKRIAENDNLRLTNPKDKDREQRKAQEKMKALHMNKGTSLTEGFASTDVLENDAIKRLNSSFLEVREEALPDDDVSDDDNVSYMKERLNEDTDAENQFLSMFETNLSPLFINYMPEVSAFEQRLKKRFAENPLYPLLLRIDIDSFLHRQPVTHLLSAAEEDVLSQKRNILGQYYDTLRQYNQLQDLDHFQTIYHGSKSFANRVYNQQFKGTLRVVRRLFSITPYGKEEAAPFSNLKSEGSSQRTLFPSVRKTTGDPIDKAAAFGDPSALRRALKFDQPLFYQPKKLDYNIQSEDSKSLGYGPSTKEEKDFKAGKSSLEPSSIPSPNEETVLNLHEELTPYTRLMQNVSPFTEPVQARPLYAGWDDELRKLVITNRSLPRSEALYKEFDALLHSSREEGDRRGDLVTPKGEQLTKGVHFTSWPLSKVAVSKDVEKSLAFLKNKNSGSEVPISPKTLNGFLSGPSGMGTNSLSESDIDGHLQDEHLQEIPHQLGFSSVADPQNQRIAEAFDSFARMQDQGSVGVNSWEMWCWPPNLRLLEDKPETMAYKRGGFVWPGHSALYFHLAPSTAGGGHRTPAGK